MPFYLFFINTITSTVLFNHCAFKYFQFSHLRTFFFSAAKKKKKKAEIKQIMLLSNAVLCFL